MVEITEKEFIQLAEYIKSNYGIHLKKEKTTLLVGRLQNVLQQHNFKTFTEYYNYLISDHSGKGLTTLVNKITTNHTFFWREVAHFNYFKTYVLPFLKQTAKNKDLLIWSAGCSSGEEPYTLAMILDEFFGSEKILWDSKILATDISENILDRAKRGVYEKEKISNLPPEWILKYFQKVGHNQYEIVERIKNEVIYRRFNLMEEIFPFKRKFHVIFCRNVMIYFDDRTKNELVQKLYERTEPGGYLFIGHSESLHREKTPYKYVMPAVYRKE